MASRLTTVSRGCPYSSRLTGISCFLPDSVRGTPGATTTSSGMKRGESAVRMALAVRSRTITLLPAIGGEDVPLS